ncbi:MAG: response regulator [Candidatus Rokubacteria bacterium]|nr:response regulator [Candidatus Rokubacteria bacterium]
MSPIFDRHTAERDAEREESLQSRFTQAQKMEVVGQLAAGVAHDFNNLLTIILAQVGILLNEPLAEPQRKRVEAIHRAGERGCALTRKLLAFSRRQVIEARVFDLNALILDLAETLRRLLSENIELVTCCGADGAMIRADPRQIEQAIINLAINARDAMPRGGTLTIETTTAGADPAVGPGPPGIAAGGSVLLAVIDTGTGMSEEAKAHLFEAFFTTKAPGKGTGLGLATVHDIITQSGGEIACESAVGRGTTFAISLPRVRGEVTPTADQWVYGDLPRGTETILVVEDDDDIREIAREILTEQGYTLLDAADGDRALRLSSGRPGPIHLLLTDVVMPGMGGGRLAGQLSAARPEMKVLYVSGHTDDVIAHSGVLLRDQAFLRKPFTPLGLARKVREALDARSPARGAVSPGAEPR